MGWGSVPFGYEIRDANFAYVETQNFTYVETQILRM